MKKTLLLAVLTFLAIADLSAQYYTNQNKVWAFGTHAGVDFTSGSPVAFSTTINTTEGCASVSNAAGGLLFYTDGKTVYTRTGSVMPSGSSIVSFLTASATQGSVIVPVIGNPNQYYVFSLEQWAGSGACRLAYSIVDMTLNGGMGDVMPGFSGVSMGGLFTEKMTAVAGNNCNVWLLTHRLDSAVFWAYNITSAGISGPVVSSIGSFTGANNYALGVLKFSPNRLKLVSQCYTAAHGTELFDFDPSTGIISNCQLLDNTTTEYGAEFSSDNTKLYAQLYANIVYQYDISLSTTSAIMGSKTTVASSGSWGDLKLASDNKIYLVEVGGGYLDCIAFPNLSGTACGYTSHAVTLVSGTHGEDGLPNIVISVTPADTFYAHHDTLACIPTGGSIIVTAHDTDISSDYLWSDGVTTTKTLSVTSFGNYWVKIYNGCKLTIDTIHVAPLSPDTITGTAAICAGATIALTASVSGGTWSSLASGIATVGSGTGIVAGVSSGTAAISYTVSSRCPAGVTVTVNPTPASITGVLSLCAGATTALANSISGGTWSSSNTTVATVNSSTGIVTGAAPGNTTISYSLGTGCASATAIVTVNPLPGAIAGATHICTGTTTTLTDTAAGGFWSSSNASAATINTFTGFLSGTSIGITTISYTLASGCATAITETVDPVPSYITGLGSLCTGLTTTITDGISGGLWSSSSTSVATIGSVSGLVTGAGPGTVSMTYTLPTGCAAAISLAVYPMPLPIAGPSTVCTGSAITLTDPTTGGTWSSHDPALATVDFTGGVVTGIYYGTTTISYTTGPGCAATAAITINPAPAAVIGIPNVCAGSVTYLYDGTAGGTWSSGNLPVATVDPTGAVTGVAPGTAVISYTLGTGCAATDTVTVNPLPGAITGSASVCVGLTTTLSDPSTGGTWSSGSSFIATVGSATGAVTGVSLGTARITYALPSGCFAVITVTVNTSPGAITGTKSICAGSTTTLSDPAGGGTWSSSATTTATIGTTSGIVSGVAPGTTTITYSLGAGCSVTAVVTVNLLPSGITGTATVCAGSTTALTDGGGGTWSPATGSVASVNTTGVVTGVTAGVAIITYTLPTGCATTKTVTVNALPTAINGTLSLCPGTTATLSGLPAGGSWSPASGIVATVGSTGVVSGISAGMAAITYTLPTGCARTVTATVNPLPAVPAAVGTGSMRLCAGATITLTDGTGGGTWSTTATIATVGSTGIVTGLSSGTAIITYTLSTGCARTAVVTVDPLPSPISGPAAVCVGAAIPETDIITGGTWVSGTPAVATILGSGLVTGAALGSTTITYTLPTGCAMTKVVSVSLSPVAISGAPGVCAGDTTTLNDAVSGGAWSSSNTSVATIGSLTGTVTGIAPGTTTITYSLGTGCTVTKSMTVSAAPAGITGPASVCIGSTITLRDATTGGAWSPATGSIATVSATGVLTGSGAGVVPVSYSVAGCAATASVTVNPAPTAITGAAAVCTGATITLADGISGGTWTSSNMAAATVGTTGDVTGAAAGTTTVSYSLGAGCIATKAITVNPVSPVTGATGLCVGATTTLSDATTGGAWSPSVGGIATVVPATGVVRGVAPGTAAITYTTAAGCTATTTVTVNLAPSAITGNLHVCAGATTALSDAAGGGTWTSGNLPAATVDVSSGTITGVSPGTSVITYSLGSGCTVNATVTVNPLPPAITGAATICKGATTILSDPGSGTWSPVSGSIATVSASGVVTGVAAGIATITYTPGTGCFATKTVTVNPLPGPLAGTTNVCAGLTTTLSDTADGGAWATSNPGIATVIPIATGTGTVSALSAGSAVITYTLPTGCAVTVSVLVNAAPGAIFGTMNMCAGSTTTLSDPTSGGTWSPASGTIATVSAAGVVTGVSLGTAAISYIVGGCPAIATITVNALPPAIDGNLSVCVGSATLLSDAATGGTWSSPAGGGIVITGATGTVTGEGMGTATITYSLGAGCTITAVVTVNALPAAITGAPYICKGYTAAFTDATTGGTWSTSDPTIATATTGGVVLGTGGGAATISYTISTGCTATSAIVVAEVPPITGPAGHLCAFGDTMHVYDAMPGGTWSSTLAPVSTDGLVTGYGSGTATVTYTISTGCFATTILTINPVPGIITGTINFCLGTTTTLSDSSAGGAWSPASGSIATVSASGIVSGVSPGTATISYTLPATGCRQTVTVTVDPHPSAISGNPDVCAGAATTLGDTVGGGVWNSPGSAGIATVDGATGIVTGVSAGMATITYYLSAGCSATRMITVNPLPAAYTITGGGNYCSGTSGVHIGLSGADAGISYKLFRGTTLAGTITGPAIDFGLETTAGTYKVVAINAATTCSKNMPDSVTITVTPSVVPAVSIAASPANTVCAGTPVTFTATPVNGGTPVYQWTVNGGSVGSGGTTYSYNPSDHDLVSAAMTSSETCAIPATVSDAITMAVVTPVIPTVTINATPGTNVKPGESVTFTATVTNGGTSPAYQWEINSRPVAGATDATFTTTFGNIDTVTCVVSAGGICNPEGSNSVLIVVSNVGVKAPPGLPRGEVMVLPNPNDGEFIIRGTLGATQDEGVSLEITDMLGQVVYRDVVVAKDGKLNERISLSNALANGNYLLMLRSAGSNNIFHIVIVR